jgi:hypothetical protein
VLKARGLTLVLGLWKSDRGLAGFPFTALLEQLDALEAFEDGTFAAYGGAGLEAVVLGHLGMRLKIAGRRKLGTAFLHGNPKKGKFLKKRLRVESGRLRARG